LRRKKQVVVDSSGNKVECFTIGNAADYIGMPKEELKLQLFKQKRIPFYKVVGKSGSRVIRITKRDLDDFVADKEIYDGIADRIIQARTEHVQVIRGITQKDLAKELGISVVYMNYVERKKNRVSIKTLARIAKILNKDLEWFLG
jgi:ribosome-binding protein aMBF1 (putative translation factor)